MYYEPVAERVEQETLTPHYVGRQMFVLLSSFLCFITAAFVAFNSPADGYELLFLLPIVNGLIIIVFRRVFYNPVYRIGTAIYNTITAIRLTVLPFLMSFTGEIRSEGISLGTVASRRLTVWMMIYEVIVVYIVLYIGTVKLHLDEKMLVMPSEKKLFHDGNENLVAFVAVAIFVAMWAVLPAFFTEFVFFNKIVKFINLQQSFSGAMLLNGVKLIVVGAIIYNCYRMYRLNNSQGYIFLAFVAGMFSIGFITTDVRNIALITAVVTVVVLFILFRNEASLLALVTLVLLLAGVMAVTIYTMTVDSRGAGNVSASSLLMVTLGDIEKTFQAYFAGPTNIATSLDMCNTFMYTDKLKSVAAEAAQNVFPWNMVHSRFMTVDPTFRSNYFFNFQARGRYADAVMIIPMLGQCTFYLGKLLAPLFSAICAGLLSVFENLSFKEKLFKYMYPIMYFCVLMGCSQMYNFSIQIRSITCVIIPGLCIVFFSSWLRRKLNERLN